MEFSQVETVYMAKTSRWGDVTHTDKPVSLFEAFGIDKGTISFPQLSAVLPGQVSDAQGSSGGKGGNPGPGLPGGAGNFAANQALGHQMVDAAGWGSQWSAFNSIVMAESGWNVHAANPSGAYGIPQALPGSKMASAGANWQTSAATQIKWMIGYIRSRYGNPNNAWAFHLANGWY
jgi:hypothetical protein